MGVTDHKPRSNLAVQPSKVGEWVLRDTSEGTSGDVAGPHQLGSYPDTQFPKANKTKQSMRWQTYVTTQWNYLASIFLLWPIVVINVCYIVSYGDNAETSTLVSLDIDHRKWSRLIFVGS